MLWTLLLAPGVHLVNQMNECLPPGLNSEMVPPPTAMRFRFCFTGSATSIFSFFSDVCPLSVPSRLVLE